MRVKHAARDISADVNNRTCVETWDRNWDVKLAVWAAIWMRTFAWAWHLNWIAVRVAELQQNLQIALGYCFENKMNQL